VNAINTWLIVNKTAFFAALAVKTPMIVSCAKGGGWVYRLTWIVAAVTAIFVTIELWLVVRYTS
jgi:hypothetical protein